MNPSYTLNCIRTNLRLFLYYVLLASKISIKAETYLLRTTIYTYNAFRSDSLIFSIARKRATVKYFLATTKARVFCKFALISRFLESASGTLRNIDSPSSININCRGGGTVAGQESNFHNQRAICCRILHAPSFCIRFNLNRQYLTFCVNIEKSLRPSYFERRNFGGGEKEKKIELYELNDRLHFGKWNWRMYFERRSIRSL